MEITNETVVPEHYNPNQLVTYKVIEGDKVTYPTVKVTDIEWFLQLQRTSTKSLEDLNKKIRSLENSLSEYFDMDSEDIVANICEIFGFNPTKEIEFEATVKVTGTLSVPLSSLSDFDINDVDLTVFVDSYNYNVNADTEIEDISTV